MNQRNSIQYSSDIVREILRNGNVEPSSYYLVIDGAVPSGALGTVMSQNNGVPLLYASMEYSHSSPGNSFNGTAAKSVNSLIIGASLYAASFILTTFQTKNSGIKMTLENYSDVNGANKRLLEGTIIASGYKTEMFFGAVGRFISNVDCFVIIEIFCASLSFNLLIEPKDGSGSGNQVWQVGPSQSKSTGE